MATPQPTGSSERPPPLIPADPSISNTLSNYLRAFELWCRSGFRDRTPSQEALPSILLLASDTAPGTAPKVFKVQVNSAGVVSAVQIGLGGPNPQMGSTS
jgi:hypothetical protein